MNIVDDKILSRKKFFLLFCKINNKDKTVEYENVNLKMLNSNNY